MNHQNRMSETERNQAVALYRQHRSINVVGKILGRSKEAVRRALERRGIPRAQRPDEVRVRGASTVHRMPVAPHDHLERVVKAGRRYAQMRDRQREVEREAWPLELLGQRSVDWGRG